MYGPEPPVPGLVPLPAVPGPAPPLPMGSKIVPPPTPGEFALPAAPLTLEESGSPQADNASKTGSARQLTRKVVRTVRRGWLDCFERIDSGIDLRSPETRG